MKPAKPFRVCLLLSWDVSAERPGDHARAGRSVMLWFQASCSMSCPGDMITRGVALEKPSWRRSESFRSLPPGLGNKVVTGHGRRS